MRLSRARRSRRADRGAWTLTETWERLPPARRNAVLAAGRNALLPAADMGREIAAHRSAIAERYVASKRHTIQVDFDDYMLGLSRERARGARRATRTHALAPVLTEA